MSTPSDNPASSTPASPPPPPVAIYTGPTPNPPPARARAKQQAQEIGQRIRTFRLQRNLTQGRLVELLGHGHEKWLSRIENGHQLITLSILEEIAQVLDVPLDALLKENPNPPDPKAIGARLRTARQQRGWTQAQVIESLGRGTTTWLSGIETGRRQLRPASLEKLAQIYNLTTADLLGDRPLPAPVPANGPAPPDVS